MPGNSRPQRKAPLRLNSYGAGGAGGGGGGGYFGGGGGGGGVEYYPGPSAYVYGAGAGGAGGSSYDAGAGVSDASISDVGNPASGAGGIDGRVVFAYASPAAQTCSTTITGVHPRQLVVASGMTCLVDSTQDGQVTVEPGAALSVTDSVINGTVTATDPADVRYCGVAEHGALNVTGASRPVILGDGSACGDDTILDLVTVTGTIGSVTVTGLTQDGTLTLSGNAGGVSVDGIRLSGQVYVQDNVGTAAVAVTANTVNGSLHCAGNTPASGDNGTVNTVSGVATGQCAGLAKR